MKSRAEDTWWCGRRSIFVVVSVFLSSFGLLDVMGALFLCEIGMAFFIV